MDTAFTGPHRAGVAEAEGRLAASKARIPVAAAFHGPMPIMWSPGTGADVTQRIAAPMVGGLFTSFLLELPVYPAI